MDSLKHYLADDGSVDNDSNASVDGGTSEDYDIYQNLEIEPDNELYGNGTEAHDANEDDVGLYDDLDQVDQQISTIELQETIGHLEQKCQNFEIEIGSLKSDLEQIRKQNLALKRNISSLYYTATAEIGRKDRQLKDLQRQYDTLVFRRGSNRPPVRTRDGVVIKEAVNGSKVYTIEDGQTECTLHMGRVSLSATVEHVDFHKKRLERLRSIDTIERTRPPATAEQTSKERENIEYQPSRSKVDGGESGDPLNLEDGEVAESPVKDANSLMVKAVQSIPDADKPPGNPAIKRKRSPTGRDGMRRYDQAPRSSDRSARPSDFHRSRSSHGHRSSRH